MVNRVPIFVLGNKGCKDKSFMCAYMVPTDPIEPVDVQTSSIGDIGWARMVS